MTADQEKRYRFLLSFLLDRGVLYRHDNGVWRLRGIYGVDDSGLKGAGRSPEEALDNAIVAVNLDPVSAERFWRESLDYATAACRQVVADDGARESFETYWKRHQQESWAKTYDGMSGKSCPEHWGDNFKAEARRVWQAARRPVRELTDDDLLAAFTGSKDFQGRVALTWFNNDGKEVPTDVGRRIARALLARATGGGNESSIYRTHAKRPCPGL